MAKLARIICLLRLADERDGALEFLDDGDALRTSAFARVALDAGAALEDDATEAVDFGAGTSWKSSSSKRDSYELSVPS